MVWVSGSGVGETVWVNELYIPTVRGRLGGVVGLRGWVVSGLYIHSVEGMVDGVTADGMVGVRSYEMRVRCG